MSQTDFWDRIKHGAEELNIPDATFRTWKSRGRVSREQAIPIYQALSGTDYEVSLDQINNTH